ncbi:MAG: enoyl-CoA hydratase-related protein [Acidimicrobiia bacterium]
MALVETELDGGVLTVTLADADRRNALGPELVGELVAALDAADAEEAVRVVVLTNVGTTFCAGADLRAMSGARAGGAGPVPPAELFARFARSPKPYVGRIAGHCVAGGMGLAAALDVSIALDEARFGFTEVRVGVVPAIVSVVCLPKMRPADARAAFLTGRRFSGTEAAAMGLVNAAVPRDGLDAAVGAVVADLLAGGPGALAEAKRLLAEVPAMGRDAAFAWTSELSARMFASPEAAEGMAAYLDKRPPAWAPR